MEAKQPIRIFAAFEFEVRVFAIDNGKFSVMVFDTDSGETLPMWKICSSEAKAFEIAQDIADKSF